MYVVYTTGTSWGEGFAEIHFVTKKEKKAKKYCKDNEEATYKFVEVF